MHVLREAREAAGITQVQAAAKLYPKTKHSVISKIESAERRIDVIELENLCRLYGVSLVEFLKSAGFE